MMVPVLSRIMVSTSPQASTALPDMAMTLKRVTRSMPAMPMADSRPPMVVGIRQTSSAIRVEMGICTPLYTRNGIQGDHHDQEDDGQGHQQGIQSDLVGGLLPGGTLHQGDHAVQEAVARLGGDADLQPVRHNGGAAGDGAEVAAALPDHRGGLAGDGGLIHRGDALNDLAVAGDDLAGA